MHIIKTIGIGFAAVSVCMAAISGIVTTTSGTAISGAAVLLEKGGLTATTGANGSFSLGTPTSISGIRNQPLQRGFSAILQGGLLRVNISEKSVVEVAAFNLNGKAILTMRQIMGAGTHTIVLPCRGAGVYLYKVKSKNSEVAVKGISSGSVSSGIDAFSHYSSSTFSAKQAISSVAVNDVISVTKAGYLNHRVVVFKSDTSGVVIKMIICADTIKDADGNLYQTVRIGNQEWTVENLRTTTYNDGSAIPLDISSATWGTVTTPKFCYYGNTTNADSIKKYGVLYNWYVVDPANPQKIAPAGWHVPSDAEWTIMEKYLVLNGYTWDGTADTSTTGNKIAKTLAAKTDWAAYTSAGTTGADLTKNNSSGFSALPGGSRSAFGVFHAMDSTGLWWCASAPDAVHGDYRGLYFDHSYFYRSGYAKVAGFSVRLVRD